MAPRWSFWLPDWSLSFSTRGNTNTDPVEAVRIDKDGKVGIGTNSPGLKLDVRGNSGVDNESVFFRAPSGVSAGQKSLTSN